MIKRGVQALAIAVLTTLASCGAQPLNTATPPPTPTVIRIYDTREVAPLTTTLTTAFSETQTDIRFETQTSNTTDMVNRLIEGEMPYFLSNHLPSDDRLWAAPIARDALAIITNLDNPVGDLSPEQIRRMYQGFSKTWEEVGAYPSDVTLYSEVAGSGTRIEFERLLMGQRRTSPNAQVVPSTTAMLASIASQAGAIGYAPFSQVNNTVRVLTISGTAPTTNTIASNTYPLRLTLYMIGLHEPEGIYNDFITWAQSPPAQNLLSPPYAPLPG